MTDKTEETSTHHHQGDLADSSRPHVLSADCWCNPRVEAVLAVEAETVGESETEEEG